MVDDPRDRHCDLDYTGVPERVSVGVRVGVRQWLGNVEGADMWNSDTEELLKKLWFYGQSAGQIADKLGCSRSAVCGKLQRLGLTRARKPPTSKPVILSVRKCSTRPSEKVSQPVRRVRKKANREGPSQRELYEILALAVRNTS